MKLDWRKLYFGRVSKLEVQRAITQPAWQGLREHLKGKSLEEKYYTLLTYLALKTEDHKRGLIDDEELRNVHVRITNYVTALSRGGLIKPEEYR